MTKLSFQKILTANDTGKTKSHQAGLHIPKSDTEFLDFLPYLDPKTKNPDSWLYCIDETSRKWKFRFVYYNNKLHDVKGTRNEYRITHMTKYFRYIGASEEDTFEITKNKSDLSYRIRIITHYPSNTEFSNRPIKLKGWTKVY